MQMIEYLKIYLGDHAALMTAELELIARCRNSNKEGETVPDLPRFLEQLASEVRNQKQTLLDLLSDMGGNRPVSKEMAGWVMEKLGRLKMNGEWTKYSDLSRVVELEAMLMASQSRVLLWETLVELDVRGETRRLSEAFVDRAKAHVDRLRIFYRDATRIAFRESELPHRVKIPVQAD